MTNKQEKILVIEDDEAIRESIQQFLEMEGYSVQTAENGKTGLNQLKLSPPPNLILLDLFMPVMNGNQFLDELKKSESTQHLKNVPVVVLTAAPPQGELAKSAYLEANDFIKKPIDLDEFLKVIEKYC